MALLRSCCCWLSVRKGSFACGVYTLILYTMLVATGGSHVSSVFHSPVGFSLILLLLSFFGLCVIFSVVLLLALIIDNRLLLLPWLTFVPMTTALDVALSLYFIKDLKFDAFVIVMYIVDYTLCSINVYCILCVLSQYQMYALERRTMGQGSRPSPKETTPRRPHSASAIVAVPRYTGGSNHGNSRCTFSRIASWPSRRISHKATFPQNGARVSPCSFMALTVPVATVTTTTTGKTTEDASNNPARENSPTPERPKECGYGIDDTSSALPLSTAEASLQHSAAEAEVPETFYNW
ncbi:uncharacterized protein LOC119448501 [Dermacentor silvarum]|uniref:uncharacterized protein LOC119448501 n=1 Tax=Dermacentor silvarum TaxID=543639 RepID=UPI00189C4649|nr:uncharacterized protein LOC119448501 [Dermacentor silvarum]